MTTPHDGAPGAPEGRAGWRVALALVAGATLVRLVLAAATPLVPDEAYYWEWSRRLAPGYYDHPGVLALLIRAGTAIAGRTSLGVRLGPVLAGGLATAVALAIAARRTGAAGARWAALILVTLPIAAVGLVLATPDAPLLLGGTVALDAVDRALGAPPRSRAALAAWVVAGAALGVAMASKYTAVLLPAMICLGFATRRELRAQFAAPGPYLATLVAFAVFAPVLAWNAAHDWVSFRFQLRHGLAGVGGSAFGREMNYLGGQAGLASPILFGLLVLACLTAVGRRGPARDHVLAVVALGLWGFFAYSALRRPVEPNWPALAVLPAAALLAARVARAPPRGGGRRWAMGGVAVGGAMAVLISVHAVVPLVRLSARRDPTAQGYGWGDAAQRVASVADSLRAAPAPASATVPGPAPTAWVAADRYQDASLLDFHRASTRDVFSLNLGGRPNQFDLWPRFADEARAGDDLLLVLDESAGIAPVVQRLTPLFDTVTRGPLLEMRRGDMVVARRRLWILRGYSGRWLATP